MHCMRCADCALVSAGHLLTAPRTVLREAVLRGVSIEERWENSRKAKVFSSNFYDFGQITYFMLQLSHL